MAITKAQFQTHISRIVHASTSLGNLTNELTEYVYALYSLTSSADGRVHYDSMLNFVPEGVPENKIRGRSNGKRGERAGRKLCGNPSRSDKGVSGNK